MHDIIKSANFKTGITFIAVGLVMIGVCVPLVLRRIKMNCWYGIRMKQSYHR